MKSSMIILYVANQERSRKFYETVLEKQPVLDVPGMSEFRLSEGMLLGLMPETGIAEIISPPMPHPATGTGIPRCELYLIVENPEDSLRRATDAGAELISAAALRDWGDIVAYCTDPDGHIIAFAK